MSFVNRAFLNNELYFALHDNQIDFPDCYFYRYDLS